MKKIKVYKTFKKSDFEVIRELVNELITLDWTSDRKDAKAFLKELKNLIDSNDRRAWKFLRNLNQLLLANRSKLLKDISK